MKDEFDLIVVGCGAAGLSAALGFALSPERAGTPMRIAVLESASRQDRGGATRWTTAGFRIDKDDRLDPLWVGRVEEVSNGLSDLDVCRRFEREVPATVAFLRDSGVEVLHRSLGLAMEFPDGAGFPNGGGHAIVDALAARFESLGCGEIVYDTEAVRLSLSEAGRIDGVVVRGPDGLLRTLRAPSVVLACGGFQGNPRMLTQYVGTDACDLRLIAPGVAGNKGAGIRMAMDVGADTAGQFDMIHSELVDRRTERADAVIYVHNYGIVVNGEGKRFYDEGQGSFDTTFELIAYEVWRNQKQTAFFIADQTIVANPVIMAMCDTDIPPVEAETIEELAGQLGLEPEDLSGTIEAYNAATREGAFDPQVLDGLATEGLDPPKSNWAYPLVKPPFIAYPLTAAITFTFGGLKADVDARVLGTNGRPIPGLYAAGEIVGLFYHQYPSATSVLRALTFGRIAGAHAAQAPAAAA